MSKLKELIDRLCPGGVEYKPLGEVCNILRGKRLTKTEMVHDGIYPVYHGGLEPLGHYDKSNREANTVMIINVGASAGTVGFCDKPFWSSDGCFCLSHSEDVQSKFAYYYLSNNQKDFVSKVRHAGIPTLDAKVIRDYVIPVPPIEIQEEIVKILDRFADYAAELQAELQARKEQYEYYRNLLLTFNPSACGCGTDGEQEIKVTTWGGHSYEIAWKTMGEIGKFFGGLTGKSKSDFTNGNARFISYMNVYSNIALNQHIEEYVYIGSDEKQNTLEFGDAIFTGSSETPDECGMSSVVTTVPSEPLYLNSFCFGYRLENKSLFVPDFLKHLLRSKSVRSQIAKTANGVTRFNVSKALFAKIVLPIPPYELQVKIASILDRFETLVNDLTQGLPAEIAAVKEQYEYYRNKLLTFKKAS